MKFGVLSRFPDQLWCDVLDCCLSDGWFLSYAFGFEFAGCSGLICCYGWTLTLGCGCLLCFLLLGFFGLVSSGVGFVCLCLDYVATWGGFMF